MKYSPFLLCIFFFFPLMSLAAYLEDVPSARNLVESKQLFEARRAGALLFWADRNIPEWTDWNKTGFLTRSPNGSAKTSIASIILSKCTLGIDCEASLDVLLEGRAYSNTGTHIHNIIRKGDYDFTLLGLTTIAYMYESDQRMSEDVRTHLLKNLLTTEGKHATLSNIWGIIPETENHILMTETSRYLKNQLNESEDTAIALHAGSKETFNNDTLGFTEWLLRHLASFLHEGFDEYNSKPYEGFTLHAIQNLYEFSDDLRMKTAAQNVLDYHALMYALQSMDLRRVVPFRRQQKLRTLDHALERDAGAARYAILAGNYAEYLPSNVWDFEPHTWPLVALGTYRVPDMILDIMIDKSHTPYLMRAHHSNTEVVYAEESFLISAGGHFHKRYAVPFFSHENGNIRPTVLMLKEGSPLISEMIRFEGNRKEQWRNNTCVYERFACGEHLVIPESITIEARRNNAYIEDDHWTFLRTGDAYIAIYREGDVGLFEVQDARMFVSLEEFAAAVKNANTDIAIDERRPSEYQTTDGTVISFIIFQKPKLLDRMTFWNTPDFQWPIRSVKKKGSELSIQSDFDVWPLLDAYHAETGEKIVSSSRGVITFYNPHLNQVLTLDMSDPMHPNHTLGSGRSRKDFTSIR